MKSIEPGHIYLVERYDDGQSKKLFDSREFMKRVGPGYSGNSEPAHGGTNCQEELRVIIDRVQYLDNQESSAQNKAILMHLRNALYLFEYRAAQRKDKLNEFFRMTDFRSDLVGIEKVKPCGICGHIFPHEQHTSQKENQNGHQE